MKNLLIVSAVDKRLTRSIFIDPLRGKERFEFNFKAGIPIEVPEEYALALIRTYPEIYSKSNLSKEEIEKLKAELPVVEEVVEPEKVKEPDVDPFKTPERKLPETISQHFPVEKTDYTEEALMEMYNAQLVEIYKKNVGQEIAINTKKTDLVASILKAQAE